MRGIGSWKRVRTRTVALLGVGALLALFTFGGSPGAGAAGQDPADLALTKSDSPDPVAENATLTYTIEVENKGPDDATNVEVTDDLPSQVADITASVPGGTCDVKGKKVTCTVASLANGATAKATVLAHPKKAGSIENSASVTSDVTDPVASNNSDTEPTSVVAAAGPSCRKKKATIVGTAAGETLTGTTGRDVIVAGDGDDTILSGGGKDLICAGTGNDFAKAGSGADFAKGGRGNDKLKGQGDGDTLKGNRGRDRLRGGGGDDLLAGGKNRDRCSGGSGHDIERSC
jgi:uncharacterized repeat protein (TIGR01451 family)